MDSARNIARACLASALKANMFVEGQGVRGRLLKIAPQSLSLEPGSSSMETSKSVENTAPKQRGRPFEPGKSGNPNGRPKGARNHATIIAEALLDGEADAITRKLIEKALGGDGGALRLCLDRLLPPRRERTVTFQLPVKVETVADATSASSSVLAAVSAGHLSLDEA